MFMGGGVDSSLVLVSAVRPSICPPVYIAKLKKVARTGVTNLLIILLFLVFVGGGLCSVVLISYFTRLSVIHDVNR